MKVKREVISYIKSMQKKGALKAYLSFIRIDLAFSGPMELLKRLSLVQLEASINRSYMRDCVFINQDISLDFQENGKVVK